MSVSLLCIKDLGLKVFQVLALVFCDGGNVYYCIIVNHFGEVLLMLLFLKKIVFCPKVRKIWCFRIDLLIQPNLKQL